MRHDLTVTEPRRYFVVVREPGPSWESGRGMREQDGWSAHAEFMDAPAEDGFIVLGGPLGDRDRALHVVEAESEDGVRARFSKDPWSDDMLRITTIDRWTILLESP